MSDYRSLIERKLEPIGESGKETIYLCPNPNCDDKSGHMYVNYQNNKFHCVKCGIGGRSIANLLRMLNISLDIDYDSLYTNNNESLNDIISMDRKENRIVGLVEYSTDRAILNEYYSYHIQPLSQQAYNYLLSRNISPECMKSLCLAEGVNRFGGKLYIKDKVFDGRDYSGRIMIPSIKRDGSISFYLGRDYTGLKSNKYSNAPKELAVASEDVWNLDLVNTDSIVICEGVMTAVAVNRALGKNIAIATYGKSIAETSSDISVRVTSQGEKILNRRFKKYIVFYDKDALSDSYKTALYLYERGASVSIVKIPNDMYGPKADAGDMTDEEIIGLIKKSEEIDNFSSLRSSLSFTDSTLL